MYIIDTHTHIYLPEFDNDRAEMMERAAVAGVNEMLLPAIDSSTHEKMMALTEAWPNCKAMIGLHPCSVKADYENEIAQVASLLERTRFVAVGEIGLDFYWDKTFINEQYTAFHQQIRLALQYDLPIAIHSREATAECIDVIRRYPGLRGVFHCFSGNEEQAVQIMDLGFYLGIGGVVTFKNAGLDKIIEKLGLDQVILETDAPYLAPVPYRGKRNEPSYTRLVAEKLAALLHLPLAGVVELTTGNARKLFRL